MKSRLRITVAAVAAAGITAALVGCLSPADSGEPRSLNLGVISEHLTLGGSSPLAGGNISHVGGQPSYEGLLAWDSSTSEFIPWLAKSFELSDDRRSMALTLRDDVDFTDGVHFDAQAVKDYFDIAMTHDGFGGKGFLEAAGFEIVVTGEYDLEITTVEGMGSDFLDKFRLTPIASPEAVLDPDKLALEPVGTGPYLLVESIPGVSASYVRNPEYWNPEAYDFDEVSLVVYDFGVSGLNALKSGQIDAVQISGNLAAEAEGSGLKIHTGGGYYVALIALDYTGKVEPAIGDVRVRQAIAMALDRAAIIEQIEFGYGTGSSQAFAKGQAEYVEGGDDRYAYDIEKARDLMEDAGYADGFSLVMAGAPAIFYPAGYEPILKQSLADIGIEVEFVAFPDATSLLTEWATGNYPLILATPAYQSTIGVIKSPPLFGHFFEDPTFDELVTVIVGGTIDESARASAELGEYMLDEAWFIPITQLPQIWATSPDIDILIGSLDVFLTLRNLTLAE